MRSLLWRDTCRLPWQLESLAETPYIVYFGFSCSYLKNKLSDPHFLLLEGDQKANSVLQNQGFKVALKSLYRIF